MRTMLAVVALAAVGCQGASRPESPGGRAVATIGLEPYFRDLRVTKVEVEGDTLVFLVDTGAGATLITPPVARRLGCAPYGVDVGHRMTGERVTFARCDSLRLAHGTWTARVAPVAVFDVNALLPPELPRLDGVLALDAFRGRVVTVDWPGASLVVRDAPGTDSAGGRAVVPLDVRFATGDAGRFLNALVRVEGTRGALWFLLDSGNLRGTLVAESVLRDSLLPLISRDEARLALGGRPPMEVSFAAAPLVIDGAVGTDLLMRGPLTLDLRGGRE